MKSLEEVKIKSGQPVLLRADFDVPLTANLKIGDDFRLKAALPTIEFFLKKKAKVILLSHLGRPEGQTSARLRLAPVAKWLRKQLGKVKYFKDTRDIDAIREMITQSSSRLFLLENLRFFPGEEKNHPEFAQKLASLGKIFVNDAFAASYRENASIVGVPQFLPTVFGFHFQEEIKNLKRTLKVGKDLVVVLGGVKTSTKIPMIKNLVSKKAVIILGGLLGTTFLAASFQKNRLDGEPLDKEDIQTAAHFLRILDKEITFARLPGKTTQIWLPLDVWVARPESKQFLLVDFTDEVSTNIPQGSQVYGLGPKTIQEYTGLIKEAKAIIFNGPMSWSHPLLGDPGSTQELAQVIAECQAFTLVGGGDTIAYLESYDLLDKIDYVSSGGGAMLAFLANETLPGIEAAKGK